MADKERAVSGDAKTTSKVRSVIKLNYLRNSLFIISNKNVEMVCILIYNIVRKLLTSFKENVIKNF